MSMNVLPGTQAVTASNAAIGVSGQPVRVFSVLLVSDTAAGSIKLHNGTTTSGDIYLEIDGTASKGTNQDFAHGVLFPSGCFMESAAGSKSGAVVFTHEL